MAAGAACCNSIASDREEVRRKRCTLGGEGSAGDCAVECWIVLLIESNGIAVRNKGLAVRSCLRHASRGQYVCCAPVFDRHDAQEEGQNHDRDKCEAHNGSPFKAICPLRNFFVGVPLRSLRGESRRREQSIALHRQLPLISIKAQLTKREAASRFPSPLEE